MQMLLSKLQACWVKEEVVKPQHEHARLPVVALDGSADNYDLLERVVDLVEWTLLLSELLGIGDVVGGLQVDAFAASVAHEVDLQLPAPGLPIPVTLTYLHHAHIHHIATAAQLIIYGVFHEVRLLYLAKTQSRVAQEIGRAHV